MTSGERDERFSRTIASAKVFGAADIDVHRFLDKSVLLTGEPPVLLTANGAEIARNALLLLMRSCRNVSVALPPECAALRGELEGLTRSIAVDELPRFVDAIDDYVGYDAILSVGTRVDPALPWTTVNSNGWLVRVSSGSKALAGACHQSNPVGALGAACLGACEVFKHLIALRPERGRLLQATTFSLWTYACGGEDSGPALVAHADIKLLLVGCGAIGNGIAHLLGILPLSGQATIVDRQTYGIENWATCLRIGPAQVGTSKAAFLAGVLTPRFKPEVRTADIADLRPEFGKSLPYPTIVLNGLDRIEPRHQTQQLWPDIAIDGAIGADATCQVSCHPWGPDIACMICMFRQPEVRAAQVQSLLTGLPETAFSDLEAILTEDLIGQAPESKRPWLRDRLGKAMCSIAADAHELSIETQREGFAPSMPFVACFSACMVVTEMLRYLQTGSALPEPRFAFNLLFGPAQGEHYPEGRRSTCVCNARAKNIDRARSLRSAEATTMDALSVVG